MSNWCNKAVIFWLSGLDLGQVQAIAEVEQLMQKGVTIRLEPRLITSLQAHHYQVITGRHPSSFGFFDTFTLQGYSIRESLEGRDQPPGSLLALLSAAGWTVHFHESVYEELANSIQHWTLVPASPSCLLVKCSIQKPLTASSATHLANALRHAQGIIGTTGLLALLSDAHAAEVQQFININNFLAEMGIIERNPRNGDIDWNSTLAFHMGHGQLRVNLRGREAQGIVQPQNEYEEVRDTLIEALPRKLRDPRTGAPVIERIYRKEELYSDHYLFCAPDMVVLFQPGYIPSLQSTRLAFDETTFIPAAPGTTAIEGAHPATLHGFLIASAPTFTQGITLADPTPLTAVAPTLLHALNVKHGPMDSAAVKACFGPEYLLTHPLPTVEEQQTLSGEEEELVISRLRDLGYI
jgi:hypothetical protein